MSPRFAFALAGLLFLAGCGGGPEESLRETLHNYAALLRWSQFEDAAGFIGPQRPGAVRLPGQDLTGIKVTGYQEKQRGLSDDGLSAYQTVEVRYYNVRDARERVVLDRQVWSYDEAAERWWLTTGLPDFSAD